MFKSSMPSPAQADRTCSTVFTISPSAPMVVPLFVVFTFSSLAAISKIFEVLVCFKNRIPAGLFDGRKFIIEFLPVCSPMPLMDILSDIVLMGK